jgi:hypothetical protein
MKIFLTLIAISFSPFFFGQNQVNFSQIAFDFYKDSISDTYLSKSKKQVCIEQQDFNYFDSECLKEYDINIDDTTVVFFPKANRIEVAKSKGLKIIKKYKKGAFPMIYFTPTFNANINQNVIGIVEVSKKNVIIYYIEMNQEGIIRRWNKCEVKK